MNLLSVNNLSRIGREKPLFTGVTFGLDEGSKAALIGRNGSGKSTLLNTIAGILQPDQGSVVMNRELSPDGTFSYLSQNPQFNPEDTILSHIFRSTSPKLNIIRQYEETCTRLESGDREMQSRFDTLTAKMDAGDLWNYESQVRSILSTLGISDLEMRMSELSGGMVKKVALAQVLVEDTPLLLLDEPTNHLDISTICYLQEYLSQTKRAVLMVTHDRYFLDAVCSRIYELDRNRLKLYEGNYSAYLEKKTSEAEIEANTERRIESVLRVERDWLMRGPCARGTKAKARIQRDMALINREKFREDSGFTFEVQGRRLGGKILELHGISKSFNGRKVIDSFSYTFSKNQKIGIFGDNGSGKSTLLNIITGSIPSDTGSVVKGENTAMAYYMQNPSFPDTNLSVLEYVQEAAEVMQMNDGSTLSASQFLEQFGFEGKIQHSPVGTLSGGEKKRLFLVRLLLGNPNFLILDEPTNDFDIFTMNILEQFLCTFKGCLLVVSHDRYFMDKVCDTLFIMHGDGSISGFVGKCSEYIEYSGTIKSEEEKKQRQQRAQQKQKEDTERKKNEEGEKRRLSFKEQKEFQELEQKIMQLEQRQKELEPLMSSPDFSISREAGQEYTMNESALNAAYARWEELAD